MRNAQRSTAALLQLPAQHRNDSGDEGRAAGANEIGIVSALSPAGHDPARPERLTCAGRILPGVDVRFRRADGTRADNGKAGCIDVRSPTMATGYRHRPVEQAAAFRDG